MGIFGKPPQNQPPVEPPRPAVQPPSPAPAPRNPCVIGAKTVIKGEIVGDEDVQVEGTVEGQVRIARDLRVGASGTIKATIEANSIVISGSVVGDCVAGGRVEIQSTGRLSGNIRAPKIVIAEGAVFRGRSDMTERRDNRPVKPESKDKAESKDKPAGS